MKLYWKLSFVGLFFLPTIALAAEISFLNFWLGGTSWKTEYSVRNDVDPLEFDEITIYFDESAYSSLSVLSAPAEWDAIVIQPEPLIPASGFYDALKLTGNASAIVYDGFSISYTFLGLGSPGPQQYDLLRSSDLSITKSGFSIPAIPIPSALVLFGGGLFALGFQNIHYLFERKAHTQSPKEPA